MTSDAADVAATDVFVLPASFAQQRLWLVDQIEPGRPTYNIPFNLRLRGALDLRALEASLTRIVERHETLRTVFDAPDGVPMQVVLPPNTVALPVTDLSVLPAGERDLELARALHAEGNRAFDLQRGPIFRAGLVRLAPDDHALLLTLHHIAADGWSLGVLRRELEIAYDAFVRGDEPALPDLPIQYADYAAWQRDQLQGAALEAQLAYWLEKLAPPLATLDLPTDRPRVANGVRCAGRVAVHVPADLAAALVALGRGVNATPYVVLLAAYQVLLSRNSGETDVIVGSPTAGRTRRETEGLIGFFVNTVALRTDLSGDPSFRTALARVQETVVGALAHQDVPFEKLVEVLEVARDRTRNPVFQTLFSLQDVPNDGRISLRGVTATELAGAAGTAKLDLHLSLHSSPNGFDGTLEYDTDLFDAATAERIARGYVTLLRAIVANPDCPGGALDLLDDADRRLVLDEWNRTDAPWPTSETLVSLVDAQARRTPDAIAVVAGAETLSYAMLQEASDRVARTLRALGVGPGVLVGVCVTRSERMVPALLGVLKAGGAYVPLDPAYPADRLAFIVHDAAARVIVTEDALRARLPWLDELTAVAGDDGPALVIAEHALSGGEQPVAPRGGVATPARAASPTDPAYVIYTSGSTGRPKGVIIEHRNAVALASWAHTVFSGDELAGVLAATSISFDLSIFEIFVTLSAGGAVIVAADALALPEVARTSSVPVTLVNTVPSAIAELVRAGAIPDTVRTVNLAGEVLAQWIVDALYALPHVERVYDLYGPSEDTTYSTFVRRERGGRPSIGRPIANTRAYVLDAQRQPVPIGVAGELYLAGAGVARGYLNRPELTAERFVTLTLSLSGGEREERAYRTGDRVRRLADGRLEYLGRFDHQVKLRGFRIELGEIEATLREHPDVKDCVAIVRTGGDTEPTLVAYYVTPTSVPSGKEAGAAASALRAQLRRTLPEHMIPAAFVRLDAIPRSPNGKLDRDALPAPGVEASGVRAYVAPRTTLEHELVHIWEDLFGRVPIGIRDDFFELGGHSLLAVQMLHEVERVRGRRLPLATLFDDATIERLAARLEAAAGSEPEPDVVVLQEDGRETPFIFVHGDVRGGGWYCRRLAPMLGRDTPLVVLPTLRAAPGASPLTIESMAALHVATVRALQPRGPYRIGGFCAGGLIAFEMARQLEAAGEEVERLVLVDATGTNARFRGLDTILRVFAHAPSEEAQLDRRAALFRKLRYYSRRWQSVRRQPASRQLRWLTTVAARRLRSRGADDVSLRASEPPPTMEFLERPATQLLRFQERAAVSYVPRAVRCDIDLIWAADPSATTALDTTHGWSEVSPRVRVRYVASPHVGLITYDLPVLAAQIRASLVGDAATDTEP